MKMANNSFSVDLSKKLSEWYSSQDVWAAEIDGNDILPSLSSLQIERLLAQLKSRWGNHPAVPPKVVLFEFKKQFESDKSFRERVLNGDVLEPENEIALPTFLRTLIVPLFITKTAALYCGIKMAQYPGEGYGYGLIASLSLTIASFLWFIQKYKIKK